MNSSGGQRRKAAKAAERPARSIYALVFDGKYSDWTLETYIAALECLKEMNKNKDLFKPMVPETLVVIRDLTRNLTGYKRVSARQRQLH